jgi:hypothetical protein
MEVVLLVKIEVNLLDLLKQIMQILLDIVYDQNSERHSYHHKHSFGVGPWNNVPEAHGAQSGKHIVSHR